MNKHTFSCKADLAIALQEVASVIYKVIKKKFKLGSKAKGPFINKVIHDNLLTEWFYLLNYCGLYPKPTELCNTWSPDLTIAHQGFVKRDKNVKVEYETLVNNLLQHPHAKWSTYARNSIFPRLLRCYTKFDSTDKPSINVLFLMMYAAQIAEVIELDNLPATSYFRLGGLFNPKSDNTHYNLDNILFKGDDHDMPIPMNHLTDLNLMDSTHQIMNVSTMGLGLFSIMDSGQKNDYTHIEKWKILDQWRLQNKGTRLLSVNSNPEPLPSITPKKKYNIRDNRARQAKPTNARVNATINRDTTETDLKTPSPANAKRKKSNEAKINDLTTERSQFDASQYATCFQELTNHMKNKKDPNLTVLEGVLLHFFNEVTNKNYNEYSKAIADHTPVKELLAESSTTIWDKDTLKMTLSMYGSKNGNKSMVMKSVSEDTFRLLGRGGDIDTNIQDADVMHCTSVYAAPAWDSHHKNRKKTSIGTQSLNNVILEAENHGWVTSIKLEGSKRPDDGDLIFCKQDAFRALIEDKDFLLDDFDVCQSKKPGEDCPPTKKRAPEDATDCPPIKKRASEDATATTDDNSMRNDDDGKSTKKNKKDNVSTNDASKGKKKNASPDKLTPRKKHTRSTTPER